MKPSTIIAQKYQEGLNDVKTLAQDTALSTRLVIDQLDRLHDEMQTRRVPVATRIEYRRTEHMIGFSGKPPYQGDVLSSPTSAADVDDMNARRGRWTWEPIGQCATDARLHVIWRGVWEPDEP